MAVVISGVVFAPDGSPVPLARVYFVEAPVPMSDIAAMTDAEGGFQLSAPAPGSYVVECSSEEYAPKRVKVEVGEQRKTHLTIGLSVRR